MQIEQNKRIFYNLLGNTLFATVTNAYVWFSLVFWAFIETQSVLATSVIGGTFAVFNMLGAFFFGNIVDHNKKKTAMMLSSFVSLIAFTVGALVYFAAPDGSFKDIGDPYLWILIFVLMVGSVAGNLRMIALSVVVRALFPVEERDKANGMVGMINGISFSLTSILSGLAIGFFGMDLVVLSSVVMVILVIAHLKFISFAEPPTAEHEEGVSKHFDLKGTWKVVREIDSLIMLIFFTTFNNLLGGVFMALMDAYGLSLMSVEAWGIMIAVMSFGFIFGSTYIPKKGLGAYPLRRLLLINVINWITCIIFVIQPWVWLLGLGMLVWMSLSPFVEATEQTIIQAIVPFERQGRVVGFAQSIESMAMPVTAFLIGPIAQFMFIPFMTTGAGVSLIGDWFGTGPDRGIALVFMTAGFLGLCMTLLAFKTRAYKVLSQQYLTAYKSNPHPEPAK
jgi:DHA3 family multidrug efflux protein-like MFS transporter